MGDDDIQESEDIEETNDQRVDNDASYRENSGQSHSADEDFIGFPENEIQESNLYQNEGNLDQRIEEQNIPEIYGEPTHAKASARNPLKRKIRSTRVKNTSKKQKK